MWKRFIGWLSGDGNKARQINNVVGGDMCSGNLIKQTISGNNNVQSSGNSVNISGSGISVVNLNGHVAINGKFKSLVINGRKINLVKYD